MNFLNNKYRIGIVAEYNPFHNGHILQINEIKRRWPDSEIIVVMSGKYVQRGEIAIISFEERKRYALEYGIDEVYQLKEEFSIQAAHIFAQEAVLELSKHNIDILFFGSETDDIDQFISIAKTLIDNEEEYYSLMRKEMKKGISFPKANQIVLEQMTNKSFTLPNDILGFEYVKTIIKNNLKIKPICMKRTIGFHSNETKDNIASASYIRELIYKKDESYTKYSPMKIDFDSIDKIDNYYDEFKNKVIQLSSDELKQYKMVSEGIENLFKKNVLICNSYDEFINLTNSKRYTSSRIKRIILSILLDLKK